MLFDPEALANKLRLLDLSLKNSALVEAVVGRFVPRPFKIVHIPRAQEPAGGATLYRIESTGGEYLLKVKHREVWVESRLESEAAFVREPSLKNEHAFVALLFQAGVPWVPKPLFFFEADELQFLALEWLDTFERAAAHLTAGQLLQSWRDLTEAAHFLFARDIVHTDLHEKNLCFRGAQIVLIDFEEARYLRQETSFEQSLDMIGANAYGNVGATEATYSPIRGLTCVARLKAVWKGLIEAKMPDLLSRCAFGQGCAFNLDECQEPDSRVYQSLRVANIETAGHRPASDPRLRLISTLGQKLFTSRRPAAHLDVGCNMGTFCFTMAALSSIRRSVGIEASADYVEAAKAFTFLQDLESKVAIFRLICGDDPLSQASDRADFVTMFSVYHHIRDKDRFLSDLAAMEPKFLVAEFATESRYYRERGDIDAEIAHIQKHLGFAHAQEIALSSDYGRPIVAFSDKGLSQWLLAVCKLQAEGAASRIQRKLRQPWRRVASALARRLRR